MPGTVKVKVVSARGLPVMDRSTDLTDAFVEVSSGVCTDTWHKKLSLYVDTMYIVYIVST